MTDSDSGENGSPGDSAFSDDGHSLLDRWEDPPPHEPLPERIGPYLILSKLAEGGSSTIYVAEQSFPRRRVALKLLDAALSIPRNRRRFQLEVQLLGSLPHPGIVQVFDAGIAELDGQERAFITMELIDGQPVTTYVENRVATGDWSAADTIRLCLGYCNALAYVHSHGIIHRDIKPANLLVTKGGVPKVIDFGIARLRPETRTESMPDPTTRVWMGTRTYMSPEQYGEDAGAIDARSDVYAIGVVLYELLVGRLPYDIEQTSLFQTADIVRHAPPKPIGRLDRRFRGDLQVILETALCKEPSERYPSMRALADDLRRYLGGHPIHARRPTAAGHLSKWCRRHPVAAVTSVAGLVILLSLTTWALNAKRQASRRSNELLRLNEIIVRAEQEVRHSSQQLTRNLDRMQRTAINRSLVRLGTLTVSDPAYVQLRLHDDLAYPPEARGFTWNLLHRASDRQLSRWTADRFGLLDLAIADDGRWIATSGPMGLCVWELPTGRRIAGFSVRLDSPGVRLGIDSAARRILFSRQDGQIGRLEIDSGTSVELPRESPARPTAIVPVTGTDTYLVADDQGTVERWSVTDASGAANGTHLWTAHYTDVPIVGITVAGDRERVGMATRDGELIIAGMDDGEVRTRHATSEEELFRVRFSPDLKWALCARRQGHLLFWNLEQNRARQTWRHRGFLPDADWIHDESDSPPNRFVISGRGQIETWEQQSRTATLYEANRSPDYDQPASDQATSGSSGPTNPVDAEPIVVDASADGRLIAVALRGGEVRCFSASTPDPFLQWDVSGKTVNHLCFSPDGASVAVSFGDGSIRVHDVDTGSPLIELQRPRPAPNRQIVFAGSNRLVAVDRDRGLTAWNLPSGDLLGIATHPDTVRQVLPLGDRLLTGIDQNGPAWLPIPGTATHVASPNRDSFRHLEFVTNHPSSGTIATLDRGHELRCWKATDEGELVEHLPDPANPILAEPSIVALAFSRDGRFFVTGSRTGRIRVREFPSGRPIADPQANATRVGSLAISPDGDVMASGHVDGELILWDTVNWEPQLYLQTGLEPIRHVEFSPSGDRLAVGGNGDHILLYEGRIPPPLPVQD